MRVRVRELRNVGWTGLKLKKRKEVNKQALKEARTDRSGGRKDEQKCGIKTVRYT